jgi:hypothetical protein
MKKIKLTRLGPGKYEALVRVKDSSFPSIVARVYGPDPSLRKTKRSPAVYYPDRWAVETDTERFFRDMFQVRRYLNTFFEQAGPEPSVR